MRRFLIVLACCAGFYLILFQAFRTVTDVSQLRTEYPHVLYNAATNTTRIEIVKKRPAQWASLGEISPLAQAAIVISEDDSFWTHNGFNWTQLWDAMETNLKEGRYARGASTITQQVVKNVFLSKEKTILRKVKEAVLTTRLESHLSKKRILEIYLNVAEFGPGVFGIGPAAHYYFQKSPASLSAKEGAFLAMLLPSPKRYGVSFRKKALTPFARGAVRGILEKLLAVHRITQEQFDALNATPFSFEASQIAPPTDGTPAPGDEEEAPDDQATPDASPEPEADATT